MTKEDFWKLPPERRKEIARRIYSAILKSEPGPKKICFGCGEEFPERTFAEINDNGDQLCERCIFVLALYTQNGIKKQVNAGSLNPSRINARFRNIVEEDFYFDPPAAYLKFLGSMIQEEEEKQRIIWIDKDELRRVEQDFPYYLMTEAEFLAFKPEPGAILTLRTRKPDRGQHDTLRRRIYAVHKTNKRTAKKYCGDDSRVYICFIPEEYDR